MTLDDYKDWLRECPLFGEHMAAWRDRLRMVSEELVRLHDANQWGPAQRAYIGFLTQERDIAWHEALRLRTILDAHKIPWQPPESP